MSRHSKTLPRVRGLMTPDNKKKLCDLLFNIGAVLLLNVTIQFVLYPFIQRRIGNDAFGVAITLLSFISITANTVGTAANYSRLVNERGLHAANGDYNLFLLLGGLASAALGVPCLAAVGLLAPVHVISFSLLILATAFRYYSDVEFKLKQNFLRYFLFYALIASGYIVGLLIYRLSGEWMLAILTGEVCGVVFSMLASGIYRRAFRPSRAFGAVWRSLGFLTLSTLVENLTVNADRLVLLALAGGETVSIYYTASLFGKVAALLTVPLNAVIISYLIRYDKPLTKKLWSAFSGAMLVLGCFVLAGCLLGSYIILPILYPDIYPLSKPYFFGAITSQVFYFISGVLLVILLRFRGEKKQFFFNLGYGAVFFALVVVGTHLFELRGFVWFSLIANVLRLAAVVLWGFLPERKTKTQ